MKYNSSNKPLVCMQTQSTCYNGTKTMTPCGILWHSTGVKNPNLKRYVQPSDTKPTADTYDKAKWIQILGKNNNSNDWNHIKRQAGLNCWIGKLADGSVTTVQTMPWNYRPWGCGSGSKGSCNSGWIQFEICEDGLTDREYFNKVYTEACEITAYLCKLYNINPNGTVTKSGVKIPTILCHKDSYKLGFGSNHGDVYHWFNKHGKTMDSVRQDVAALLKGDDIVIYMPSEDTNPENNNESETKNNTNENFAKAIQKVLIQKLSVVNTTSTTADILVNTSKNFSDYLWSYQLTTLEDAQQLPEVNISILKDNTILKIKNLIANTAYSLELFAEDKFKNKTKSPSIIFNTLPTEIEMITKVNFDYVTKKIVFNGVTYTHSYRISLIINGREQLSTIIDTAKNKQDNQVTFSVSNLLSKYNIKTCDLVQIGVSPVAYSTVYSVSAPVRVRGIGGTRISKMFLLVKERYKRAIAYLMR